MSKSTITPVTGQIKALVNYPRPTTAKQVQRFLDLAGYFLKFIYDHAKIAKPLSDILRSGISFSWEAPQEKTFHMLKQVLMQAPVLQLYRPDPETKLYCDDSKEIYAAILLQRNPEDELLHPVYYMSRKKNDTQKKYHSYELETLAIVREMEKFRIHFESLRFKIVTNRKALQQTLDC